MPFGFRRLKASISRSRLVGLQLPKARGASNSQDEYDPSQPCLIDGLPDELLAKVLLLVPWGDRLRNLERVSKRWRRVVIERGWCNFIVFDNDPYDYFVIMEQAPPKRVQRKMVAFSFLPGLITILAIRSIYRCFTSSPDVALTSWS